MSSKKENIVRVYVVYVAMLLFAFLILFQIVKVQLIDGVELKKEAKERTLVMRSIKAPRGNVFADNEPRTTLALSVPRYNVYMDLMTVKEGLFEASIEALCDSLSSIFSHKTNLMLILVHVSFEDFLKVYFEDQFMGIQPLRG